ncbi:precursor of CEP14-like [Silene latifolia]|uniref:precursor of CEP14-like n=1 Tax=Silene latifolia TaxID=37657 RepID=UPI003D77A183
MFFILFLILSISIHANCTSISHARKLLLINESKATNKQIRASLILATLPKGKTVNSSSPSKGHASTTTTATTLPDKELFMRHLAAIDRVLWSVPSPGVGH